MTKKAYMAPVATVEMAEPAQMLAASLLNPDNDNQDITFGDEDYDGEFQTKEYTIDW